MRSTFWIAILLGGGAGAVAALARVPVKPPAPLPAPALTPVAARPAEPRATRVVQASSVSKPSASAAPSAEQPPTVAPAATEPRVEITSAEELTRYEVRCHENKEPEACRAAAEAYDEGKIVEADASKSRLLRRIELTFLVRGCEGQVVPSCVELARRYEQGDGVTQNARSAKALMDRAKELCATRTAPVCETLR